MLQTRTPRPPTKPFGSCDWYRIWYDRIAGRSTSQARCRWRRATRLHQTGVGSEQKGSHRFALKAVGWVVSRSQWCSIHRGTSSGVGQPSQSYTAEREDASSHPTWTFFGSCIESHSDPLIIVSRWQSESMQKPRDTLESLAMTRSHPNLWLTYLQIRQGNCAIRNVGDHCEPRGSERWGGAKSTTPTSKERCKGLMIATNHHLRERNARSPRPHGDNASHCGAAVSLSRVMHMKNEGCNPGSQQILQRETVCLER